MTVTATTSGAPEARPNIWRRTWDSVSIIFRSRIAVIGLAIVMFWVLVAIFAPLIAPYDPVEQNSKAILQGPSSTYLLGTDKLGRDNLSRLIYGARTILIVGAYFGAAVCLCRHLPGAAWRLFWWVARRSGDAHP